MAYGFSSGPIDGVTGAPGDSTCHDVGCHSGNPLNSGGGTLAISTTATYTPGDTLDVMVDLGQQGQLRWGFELTVLNSLGQPVGELILSEPTRTQSSVSGSGRQYVKHTTLGTDSGTLDSAPGWTLTWVAPTVDSGAVTFYAAGNAANGSGTTLGDFIYTTSTIVTPTVSPCLITITGDVNLSGSLTSSDIIYLVNFVFKGGPLPQPCAASGDVNCNGAVTSSDIIFMVNHVFKGDVPPCDVCSITPGLWTCP
jgi:hypothetical protein